MANKKNCREKQSLAAAFHSATNTELYDKRSTNRTTLVNNIYMTQE